MRTNRFMLIGALCLCALMGCTSVHQSAANPGEGSRDTKSVVLGFYQEALQQKQVRPAFERFASDTFVEHKPDVPLGNRESTIRYLEELVVSLPDAQWEVVRTIAEGDLVFLHAKFVPAPGAPSYAIADIFRVQNGLIVEHWDVVAGPPKDAVNPHSRFQADGRWVVRHNDMATVDEKVLRLVSEERGVPLAQLALTTTLFGDLRVDGDDAEDLLLTFKDRFEVDMEGCRMDHHFGPEGMHGWGPLYWLCLAWRGIAEKGSTPESRSRLNPITIQDLVDSARLQKWSICY